MFLWFEASNDVIVPKLSDFGFSLVLPKTQMNEQVVGTPRWNAPELLAEEASSLRENPERLPLLDIYSYGLLVWRVLKNGLDPFGDPAVVRTADVLLLKAFSNEPLIRACKEARALVANDDPNNPHPLGFQRIFKETLPLEPLNRCRSLGWIKDAFSMQYTSLRQDNLI